jgi:hypothetical protein
MKTFSSKILEIFFASGLLSKKIMMQKNLLISIFTIMFVSFNMNGQNIATTSISNTSNICHLGKLSIGTSTANGTLDVARGTAASGTAVFRGTSRYSHFNYSTNEDTYIRGGLSNSNVYLNDNGGNVGIGTTSPSAKLHVNGGINVNGKIAFNSGSNSYYTGITLDANNLVFNVGPNSPTMKITNAGVYIGCSLSSGLLNVNGKIQASEIEIKTTPCSDFVFENDYKLKNINEVERFVTENKHLPDVPSAKEFSEKGSYSLNQMDNLLLQKVEELTLYIIEQNKRIEVLEKENKAFETLNK